MSTCLKTKNKRQ